MLSLSVHELFMKDQLHFFCEKGQYIIFTSRNCVWEYKRNIWSENFFNLLLLHRILHAAEFADFIGGRLFLFLKKFHVKSIIAETKYIRIILAKAQILFSGISFYFPNVKLDIFICSIFK